MPEAARQDLKLHGCTPEPLMAYLKALGILRLVSEQKDPEALAWWEDDVFRLRTRLESDALTTFFLGEYRPTPIVTPWAGGSGFFKKDNKRAVQALASSSGTRVELYRNVIHAVQAIISEEEIGDKPQDEQKSRLIRRYRRELPDQVVAWMDAAMVLHQNTQGFAPLLGTGGNDGRLDFAQNFMQRIVSVGLHEEKCPSKQSRELLTLALFSLPAKLESASVGQFAPGRAGGQNATQGMEGEANDNPWDFILMIEGALMLAGDVVRRFGVAESGRPVFPFTVRPVAAGFDSRSSKDESESRGELWLPIWDRPTGVGELRQLFGEGRASVSGRYARNGTDFARAIASLGVDRGIRTFARLAFLKRYGKAFLAAPLGRFKVIERPSIDLLREVDAWLDRFRRAAGDKNAPSRFGATIRRIDCAIFDFCRYGGPGFLQKVLVAIGAAERELANAERFRDEKKLSPLPSLSAAWIEATNDGSAEFNVALALADVHHEPDQPAEQPKIGPIRVNLEPADWTKRFRAWAERDRAVVWNAADLPTNLAAVLARRMMDGARAGCKHLPLASRFSALPEHIAAFIEGYLGSERFDFQRTEELLWCLMLVKPRASNGRTTRIDPGLQARRFPPLRREYALLKLLFLPRPLTFDHKADNKEFCRFAREREAQIVIRPEPRLLPLLRAGQIGEACRIAAQRLRVSGLAPLPAPKRRT